MNRWHSWAVLVLIAILLAGCGFGPFSKPEGDKKGMGFSVPLSRQASGIEREDLLSSDNIDLSRVAPADPGAPGIPPTNYGAPLSSAPAR